MQFSIAPHIPPGREGVGDTDAREFVCLESSEIVRSPRATARQAGICSHSQGGTCRYLDIYWCVCEFAGARPVALFTMAHGGIHNRIAYPIYKSISLSPVDHTWHHQVPTGSHAHVSDTLHSPCQRNASRRCTGPVHTFSPGGHTWLPPGIPRQSPSHMSDPVALPNSTDRRTGMLYACTGAHLVE